jgi:hypothetical protein
MKKYTMMALWNLHCGFNSSYFILLCISFFRLHRKVQEGMEVWFFYSNIRLEEEYIEINHEKTYSDGFMESTLWI